MAEFDKFAQNYNEMLNQCVRFGGENWDYFTRNRANYVTQFMASDFSGKVLDFGCGIGNLAVILKELRPRLFIHGFEVSEESIKKIPSHLLSQGKFVSALEKLDSDYDFIVVAGVFHHIPVEERMQTMRELKKRLSPQGQVIIFEHNPANPITRRVVSQCPFDDNAVLLYPGEIKKYLQAANLSKIHQDYIVFFPGFLSFMRRFESRLSWLPLGAQYAVVGKHIHI